MSCDKREEPIVSELRAPIDNSSPEIESDSIEAKDESCSKASALILIAVTQLSVPMLVVAVEAVPGDSVVGSFNFLV